MLPSFIFDTSKGETPETVARKRAIAAQIMGQIGNRPARNTGEGIGNALASIGHGIAANVTNRRASRAEQEGQAGANSLYDQIINGLTTGTPIGMGGGDTPQMAFAGQPMDYASSRVAAAHGDPAIRQGIIDTAASLGIDPVDLATAISYETAGTFDPAKAGPTTKWGQHKGFIQFGEPQAAEHGVNWNDPVGSQLGPDGAVASYLRSTGVEPGMGLLDIYSAINAGGVGRYDRSDAHAGGAPGTVRDKVEQQMAGHREKALAYIGDYNPTQGQLESLPVGGSMQMPQASGMAGNLPAPDAPFPPAPQQMAQASGFGLQELLQAASNPWLNDGQRGAINMLIQQQMAAQQADQARQQRIQAAQDAGIDPRFAGDDDIWKAGVGQHFQDPTTDIQEYEYALGQGFEGSFTDFQQAKRKAGAINVDARNMGNIPPGYRVNYDESGNPVSMEPIEGGPAWQDQAASEQSEAARIRNAQDYARTVTQDIGIAESYLDSIGTISGADNVVGGLVSEFRANKMPRSAESNMRAFVESALSNVTLDTMNRMREGSPAGATGFGNMSEKQMAVIRGVLGQWEPGLPLHDQRYILHRLGNFYMDVAMGTRAEREQAVREGRMTPAENAEIEAMYYPETRDIRGRRIGHQDESKPMTEMTDEELEAIINGNR